MWRVDPAAYTLSRAAAGSTADCSGNGIALLRIGDRPCGQTEPVSACVAFVRGVPVWYRHGSTPDPFPVSVGHGHAVARSVHERDV